MDYQYWIAVSTFILVVVLIFAFSQIEQGRRSAVDRVFLLVGILGIILLFYLSADAGEYRYGEFEHGGTRYVGRYYSEGGGVDSLGYRVETFGPLETNPDGSPRDAKRGVHFDPWGVDVLDGR